MRTKDQARRAAQQICYDYKLFAYADTADGTLIANPKDEDRIAGIIEGYMLAPRCDGCRWWRPFAAALQPGNIGGIVKRLTDEGFGAQLAQVDLQQLLGDCELFECRGKEQVHDASKLQVTRTRSGEATIVTAADFGCVQWEAKP